MGVSQGNQSSYFMPNIMINNVLTDMSSIPAAQNVCFVPEEDVQVFHQSGVLSIPNSTGLLT